MANPFVHMELNTSDVVKAKDFYSKLFNWSFQDIDSAMGTYSMFKPTDGPGGGIFSVPGAPTGNAWLPYIGVEDINASTDQAISLGAKLLHRDEVPGMGWFSVLADPTGAHIALWQQKM